MLNAIVTLHFANTTVKEIKPLIEMIVAILCILFMPELIELLLAELQVEIKKLLQGILIKGMDATINYFCSLITQIAFKKIADYIETNTMGLYDKNMYGSHSIIAKDEKFSKENCHYQATRMANFMDKTILLSLFYKTHLNEDKKGYNAIDMDVLLEQFLCNPLVNAASATVKKKEAVYFNTTIRVHGSYPLKKLYQLGQYHCAQNHKKDYDEAFFNVNYITPQSVKKDLNVKQAKKITGPSRYKPELTATYTTADWPRPIQRSAKDKYEQDWFYIMLPYQKDPIYAEIDNEKLFYSNQQIIHSGEYLPPIQWWKLFYDEELYKNPIKGKSLWEFIVDEYTPDEPHEAPTEEPFDFEAMDLNGIYENVYAISESAFKIIGSTQIGAKIKASEAVETKLKKEYERFIENYLNNIR